MSILTRYVAKAYLRMLGLCLGSFVTIYLVVDFMEKIGRFSRSGASWQHLALFFITKIPEMISDSAPLAVLMATLLTLGAFSLSSELTAMRSCGISLVRISAPILGISLLMSLTVLALGEFVIPKTYAQRLYIQAVLIQKKAPGMYFRQHNIWYREGDTVLRASLFEPSLNQLKGVTIWEMQPGTGLPLRRTDSTLGELGPRGWTLSEVVVRDFQGAEVMKTRKYPQLLAPLKLKPADLKVLGRYSDSMTLRQLNRYCKKIQAGGYDATRYITQFHSRISLPFGCAVMAFLGIPFALRGGRSSGIAFGVGISIGVGFLYVIINSVIISVGQVGLLPPVVAAWATNFIFLAAGGWLALTIDN
ncbi:LPS export ABC transporter permease LptG [Geomonas subterranea]|uniref:LPS export ABC transporter permease LptG n=1 Tax=Geomonas subterranea TaxID=2847989 RepID=A0ABX8LF07_9BACT|nr:LPS export ABC transporter permease LptG [Geomonas subterranea]QXE90635.1 LPS export ABC transporter permease LptG [Geomonas subterranea]QXM11285.1 LPS export ABC transporter permease LptG [Geomonas subterranea]